MASVSSSSPARERWPTAILPQASLLQRNWTFTPTVPSLRTRLVRIGAARRAGAFPAFRVHRPVVSAERWNCLFLFCPDARPDAAQVALLGAARALRGRLMVVVALPSGAVMPAVLGVADALVEKELRGFDFSAYRIALSLVAAGSPGALAYLQNDSVLGPLAPLDPLVDHAPWDLTGFLGSPAVENHLSSFALVVRAVTPDRLAALTPALPGNRSFNRFTDVVAMQETRLARIAAARGIGAGAHWFIADVPPEPSPIRGGLRRLTRRPAPPTPLDLRGDPMLGMPLDLIRQGFPFVKRSLFGKFAGSPAQHELAALLHARGWPVPSGT